jgi:hypothetical protein
LNSRCCEALKTAIKQKIEQTNRGRKNKNWRKKNIFVMSPDGLLCVKKRGFCYIFELPLLRNAQRNAHEKDIVKKKQVTALFWGLR